MDRTEAYLHNNNNIIIIDQFVTRQMPVSQIPNGILIDPAIWPHGPKIGGRLLCPFLGRGELASHPTQCGTSVPTGILIHPAVWQQQRWADPASPFWGEAGSPPNTLAWAEVYLNTKWHLDPSNHLATIQQRHR